MNALANTSISQRPSRLKPIRPPLYVTQISPDGNVPIRIKKAEDHGESLFKRVGEAKKLSHKLKQRVAAPVKFAVVGNTADSVGHTSVEIEHSDHIRSERSEPHSQPSFRVPSNSALIASLNTTYGGYPSEQSDNNEAAMPINITSVSVDKGLRPAATALQRENVEQQRLALGKPVQNETNSRKPLLPSVLQKATQTTMTTGNNVDNAKAEVDFIVFDADNLFPRKPRITLATKVGNPRDTIQTGGTKIPMVERVTLEGEISRLKSMVMPDFARDLFLGRFAMPKQHFSLRAPSLVYLERARMLDDARQKSSDSQTPPSSRLLSHTQSALCLRDDDDQTGMMNELRAGLSKRELTCLKHHLLRPLPIENMHEPHNLSYNVLSVKPFSNRTADEVDHAQPIFRSLRRIDTLILPSLKPRESQSLAVGKGDESKLPTKKQGRRTNGAVLWADTMKRRYSRSLPSESIIVRRYSKGRLKPAHFREPKSRNEYSANSNDSDQSSSGSLSPIALKRIHPVTEEATATEFSGWDGNDHGQQVVTQQSSHRSSLAFPNSISRAAHSQQAETSDGSQMLSNRSRLTAVRSKIGIDQTSSRMSAILHGMLRKLKTYYAQPQQGRIVIPRHELLTRFRKLDTDADGHLNCTQLVSSLPALLTPGQRRFITAIYNLAVDSSPFGFEEFTGIYMLCNKLESLKSDLSKRAFEQLERFDLESAVEFFLSLYEQLNRSSDEMASQRNDHRQEGIDLDRLVEALRENEMLQQFSNSLAAKSQQRSQGAASAQSSYNSITEAQLQLIRHVFLDENLTTCDELQFLILIPLFLVVFKPEQFAIGHNKRLKTLDEAC